MASHAETGKKRWTVGPYGELLTEDGLPPEGTERWTIRHKATLVAAVEGHLLTMADLHRRYGVTPVEFRDWQKAVSKYGMPGLRVTRIVKYRASERRFPGLERRIR